MQHGADAPAGFIGTDDGTPRDLGTQGPVGRGGHARCAMQGLDEAARRDSEPEAVTQQRRDLLERYADVLVQEHNQGHGTGPEVPHWRPPPRRTSATDAGPGRGGHRPTQPPMCHVEAPDDRPHDGQIFLILRGDAGCVGSRRHSPGRRREARPRKSHRPALEWVVGSDARRRRRRAVPAVCRSPGADFCERGGLTEAGAPCRIELLFQARILTRQVVALATRPRQRLAQAREFFLLAPDQVVAVLAGRARASLPHKIYGRLVATVQVQNCKSGAVTTEHPLNKDGRRYFSGVRQRWSS